jgi:hypothetical protein
MTTNQTIDGVPRDCVLRLTTEAHEVLLGMVEHCLNIRACMGMDEGFKDFDTEEEHDFVKELRALLDAPACKRCNGSGWIDNLRLVGTQAMDCPDCNPAGQVQGEPVAWVEIAGDGSFWPDSYTTENMSNTLGYIPLYSKQPAPLAADLTDEEIIEAMRPAIYAADGGYVFDTAPEKVIAAGRSLLALAAPVGPMVLPERMDRPEECYSGPVWENEGECCTADGWNACIDSANRLNDINQ